MRGIFGRLDNKNDPRLWAAIATRTGFLPFYDLSYAMAVQYALLEMMESDKTGGFQNPENRERVYNLAIFKNRPRRPRHNLF